MVGLLLLIIAIVALAWALIVLGVRAMRNPYVTGAEDILNSIGVTKTELTPKGKVFVDGALWEAVSDEGNIEEGVDVVVVEVKKLTVRVRRA